jgi:hypothetical protein
MRIEAVVMSDVVGFMPDAVGAIAVGATILLCSP